MATMYEQLEDRKVSLIKFEQEVQNQKGTIDEDEDGDEEIEKYQELKENEAKLEKDKELKDSAGLDDDIGKLAQEIPLAEVQKLPMRKAPDLPQIERRNWLLHHHFVRKEISTCKALIKEQLDETSNMCEYALYLKGIILRQEGKIQESLDIFQQCAILNSQNVDYVKQIARSL